jgi:ribosomal protein S18 acetylase RimI-like enzyme
MPTISTFVECDIHNSFRVQQIAGMFDIPLTAKTRESFTAELPGLDEEWTIGAIVGPSGSGKTTLARHAYGDAVWRPGAWPEDRAVIDGFGDLSIKEITHTLTAVGLSSPPSWVKPYGVLSNGEKFRCDLAKALLAGSREWGVASRDKTNDSTPYSLLPTPYSPLVVFDEFTSVVDRTAARIGAAAVAKAIRSGRIQRRFVAVTCHYDVLEWLEVDWHLDLAAGRLERRRLRRPELRLSVVRADASLWPLFVRHHYLSGSIPAASVCYVALINDLGQLANDGETSTKYEGQSTNEEKEPEYLAPLVRPSSLVLRPSMMPVAFCSVSNLFGGQGRRRISRLVVLPDFQGVGIGAKLLDAVAEHHHTQLGQTIRITTSHPAMLAYLQRSPRWRAVHVYPNTRRRKRTIAGKRVKDASGRCVATFEFGE